MRELAALRVGAQGAEVAYGALQRRARAALRDAGPVPEPAAAERFGAWLCGGCGRVEAPQPCLGVCVRHDEEVVRADHHAGAAARAADADRDARALAAFVRRLAWVTPRAGRFEESLLALRDEALGLLGAAA